MVCGRNASRYDRCGGLAFEARRGPTFHIGRWCAVSVAGGEVVVEVRGEGWESHGAGGDEVGGEVGVAVSLFV